MQCDILDASPRLWSAAHCAALWDSATATKSVMTLVRVAGSLAETPGMAGLKELQKSGRRHRRMRQGLRIDLTAPGAWLPYPLAPKCEARLHPKAMRMPPLTSAMSSATPQTTPTNLVVATLVTVAKHVTNITTERVARLRREAVRNIKLSTRTAT